MIYCLMIYWYNSYFTGRYIYMW